jgi:ATP-dependent DNA helicase RecQ
MEDQHSELKRESQITELEMEDQHNELKASLHVSLRELYGQDAQFRNFQLEAMLSLAEGVDTLLCLPTGTGKSLIYGLPPVALGPGFFSVVVTPLIALGKNQVRSLADELEVDARLFTNSSCTPEEQKKMAEDLKDEDGSIQVLITTPETLARNQLLRDALSIASDAGKLFCIAVDEAHVAHQWGHDFRPAYALLAETLQIIDRTRVPIYACTASANRDAQDAILETLSMSLNAARFVASADRPEIQLSVVYKELLDKNERDPVAKEMAAFITDDSCGLIYCRTKSTCDAVAKRLQCIEGLEERVGTYHADLDQRIRERNQAAWEEGDLNVLVCTVAFGLGVNKSNVRWVLHYDPPGDLADFYQQVGRAGRDGELARSVLFVSHEEVAKGKRYGGMRGMDDYVYGGSCRRKVLTSFFGAAKSCSGLDPQFKCDVCLKTSRLNEALDRIERLAAENAEGRTPANEVKRPLGDPSPLKPLRPAVLRKLGSPSNNTNTSTNGSNANAKVLALAPDSSLRAAFVSPWKGGGGGGGGGGDTGTKERQ